ncbi:hypothetical protein, partial [Pseudoteredinibacter isoporae]
VVLNNHQTLNHLPEKLCFSALPRQERRALYADQKPWQALFGVFLQKHFETLNFASICSKTTREPNRKAALRRPVSDGSL